ncbi:uncharacterized protein HMPREF1541_06789 [Cyphellophora europaea CBS 101466]|uniref:Protein farnesyltransferase/geranylgeranyltransferase type-1 subunit alpha n=1 Tax=Cyphellophora europaea (strain CBS 101466) TaxID=1220924 RepID=W2RQE6_CYPE1|nr:uncharacterized protein HMPREF1541_06789 [Cyphellophora europaea CBS 101466]ETN38751.1 hypothetical protein HMPREF1541_06789 [Cyphellophora europaea CBS 101466]
MAPYNYSHLRAPARAKEPFYATSEFWTDINPIPLMEGAPQAPSKPGEDLPTQSAPALATIAYSKRYLEAMSYLRAVMAQNEFSERCLALTEDIIGMNPAHYTVWLYRMKCLRELWGVNTQETEQVAENEKKIEMGVDGELEWLESVSERNLKNYQIWHHRQSLLSLLPESSVLPPSEISFLAHILSFDAKNYHVWTYRQWLCRRYASTLLVDPSPELIEMEKLLNDDCRNNSAWSHRYFVVFGLEELELMEKGDKVRKEILDEGLLPVDEAAVEREIAYAKEWIEVAPQNPSPWNYLRGVLKRAGRNLQSEREFCETFVRPAGEEGVELDFEGDAVRSSHAIDWLSQAYVEQGTEEGKEKARRCLQALGTKWDIIRKNYWDYRAKGL